MSIIYNGTTIAKLVYNGTEVQTATYNGTSVFSGVDPTKSSYTESEFIAVVNAGLQGKMTVGATVALTNSYCSSYNVIGVNHDGTSGTVDLYGNSCCNSSVAFGSSQYWANCALRTWLNGTFVNAFTNVSSLIKTMSVSTNGSTTSDKVKLLSVTEIGATNSYMISGEGTKYEAFSSHSGGTSGFSDVYRSGNSYNWLRSRSTNYSRYVWYVSSDGYLVYNDYSYSRGAAAVLRF